MGKMAIINTIEFVIRLLIAAPIISIPVVVVSGIAPPFTLLISYGLFGIISLIVLVNLSMHLQWKI